MLVNLNKLEYRKAFDLIRWCVANQIDYTRALELMYAWYADPDTKLEVEWVLDIPDKYLTYWVLKWSK